MNKREMMIQAHKLASKMVGNYSARLSLALTQLWAVVKNGVAKIVNTLVKCDFYGSRIIVDIATGEITGDTYTVKGQLKKFHASTWSADKKVWVIGSTATFTKQDHIDSLVNRYAVK